MWTQYFECTVYFSLMCNLMCSRAITGEWFCKVQYHVNELLQSSHPCEINCVCLYMLWLVCVRMCVCVYLSPRFHLHVPIFGCVLYSVRFGCMWGSASDITTDCLSDCAASWVTAVATYVCQCRLQKKKVHVSIDLIMLFKTFQIIIAENTLS